MSKNGSQSEEMMSLAKRALHHFKNNTTDQAPEVMSQPIEAYTDRKRFSKEVERIFKHLPIALCLSNEIPDKEDYKAVNVLDIPILITRAQDNKVRAFLNVCRHRGAKVCEEGSGKKRIFSCPYHAWTYSHEGALVGMYGEDTFGNIDQEDYGLLELECQERAGLIWAMLKRGEKFDIDKWLGDFAVELESLDLKNWHIFEQRVLEGPGWKVTFDGYLEVYHHNQLHNNTVGRLTVGNLLVLDTYGPHQRLTFGRKSLEKLNKLPESEWNPLENIRLIHSVFPNLSISGILGDHCLVSQVFPSSSPNKTLTFQTIMSAKKPSSKEEISNSEAFSKMVLQAVKEEDYKMGLEVQSNITNLSEDYFVYGRNEPAVQNYHSWIKKFMERDGSNW